jgi:glycosyltransferase involved in cell wall biosynthesis
VERFERALPSPALEFEGNKVVGMVARLDLQKGFEYLLGAARELCGAFPALKVVIVGEGPDRQAIESMIQRFGLQSKVILAGQHSDMPGIYAAMDIFVLPSLNEGLPMTILEAMAASRPVIATRVGAIPSVIKDGETGLLVDPGDVNGLRDALTRLLTDSDLCCSIGSAGHDWVSRNYTSEAMALKYRAMYDEVLGLAAITTVPTPALDNRNADARRA